MPGAEPSRGQWGWGEWVEGFPTSGHAEDTERAVTEGRRCSTASAAGGTRQQVKDALDTIFFNTAKMYIKHTQFKLVHPKMKILSFTNSYQILIVIILLIWEVVA